MKTFQVKDMHCAKCVERIDNALTGAGIDHTVSLPDKTVTVEEDKAPAAAELLDDLGFTAE